MPFSHEIKRGKSSSVSSVGCIKNLMYRLQKHTKLPGSYVALAKTRITGLQPYCCSSEDQYPTVQAWRAVSCDGDGARAGAGVGAERTEFPNQMRRSGKMSDFIVLIALNLSGWRKDYPSFHMVPPPPLLWDSAAIPEWADRMRNA